MGVRGRMRALNTLLEIRFGPGAAILPKDVTRIHLDFARNWNNGHLGPRRFWRTCLPRLKYHNPMVSMTVQRTIDQATKPIMTIHFEGTRTKTIDMQMKTHEDILQEFMTSTKAVEVVPSPEEEEAIEEVKVQAAKSEEDWRRTTAHKAKLKEEARLLERARQSI